MNAVALSGVLALSAGLTLAPQRAPDEPRKLPEPELHGVTREIFALRTLFYLRFTRDQLEALAKIAKGTAAPPREHNRARASEDYRRLLGELRTALVSAGDAERIDDLEEKVGDLQESERPQVDDGIVITEEAR